MYPAAQDRSCDGNPGQLAPEPCPSAPNALFYPWHLVPDLAIRMPSKWEFSGTMQKGPGFQTGSAPQPHPHHGIWLLSFDMRSWTQRVSEVRVLTVAETGFHEARPQEVPRRGPTLCPGLGSPKPPRGLRACPLFITKPFQTQPICPSTPPPSPRPSCPPGQLPWGLFDLPPSALPASQPWVVMRPPHLPLVPGRAPHHHAPLHCERRL